MFLTDWQGRFGEVQLPGDHAELLHRDRAAEDEGVGAGPLVLRLEAGREQLGQVRPRGDVRREQDRHHWRGGPGGGHQRAGVPEPDGIGEGACGVPEVCPACELQRCATRQR